MLDDIDAASTLSSADTYDLSVINERSLLPCAEKQHPDFLSFLH
jgi:hypothetical protein